jgi:hypothetical protein
MAQQLGEPQHVSGHGVQLYSPPWWYVKGPLRFAKSKSLIRASYEPTGTWSMMSKRNGTLYISGLSFPTTA